MKDSRGDYYPRSNWLNRDSRARSLPDDSPSGRENMSDVESVNPNITQNPLNQAETSKKAAETTIFHVGCRSEQDKEIMSVYGDRTRS